MDVHQDLQNHKAEDQVAHIYIQETRQDIKTIKENHLAHIQASMTNMEADLRWFKWILGAIGTAAIGSLIAAIMNLILK